MTFEVTYVWPPEVSVEDDAVSFRIANEEMQGFELTLSRHVANLLIGNLVAATGQIEAALPEDERSERQFIAAVQAETGVLNDGRTALLLTLEGGAVIPLALDSEALASLSAELVLQGATASQRPN